MSHVLLVGFMGSGKSSVGPLVAEHLGRTFVDLDEEVERRVGRSIQDIFCDRGESAFRADEREALLALAKEPPSVVACGGGIVFDERNRADLRRLGTVIWLRVSLDTAVTRVGANSGRPLMDGRPRAELVSLLSVRDPLYREVADIEVATDGAEPAAVADTVVSRLNEVVA